MLVLESGDAAAFEILGKAFVAKSVGGRLERFESLCEILVISFHELRLRGSRHWIESLVEGVVGAGDLEEVLID